MPGTGCTLTTPNPEFNDSPDFAGDPSANPSTRNIVAFSVMCLGMYLALTNIQIVNSSFNRDTRRPCGRFRSNRLGVNIGPNRRFRPTLLAFFQE